MADNEEKDQKTEEATPRRREEAREKGQVAISTEMMAALGLAAGAGAFVLAGGGLARSVGALVQDVLSSLGDLGTASLTAEDGAALVGGSVRAVLPALGLVVAPPLVVATLAGYLQVGVRISPKALEFDPSKIDPIRGFGRLFGLRSLVRTVMAAAKVSLIGLTMVAIAWSQLGRIVRMGVNELGPLLAGLGHIALRCAAGALVVVVLLSLMDLLYQRFQHSRDLRMSKQDLKEELKVTEGDPHVRARIRQIQREMATRRMMAEVPTATVVVTNPTHYAVALSYERDERGVPRRDAPLVVAKGVDHVAQRIKQVAAKNSVVCYEDVSLARALHAQVEIGQEIPEDLYAAVAAVLGYVMRLRGEVVRA